MIQPMLTRVLTLLWAVALALLSLIVLGHTHMFSWLVGEAHVALAVDLALLLLTVAYVFLLRPVVSRVRLPWLRMAALLPPCLLLWSLLF